MAVNYGLMTDERWQALTEISFKGRTAGYNLLDCIKNVETYKFWK
jgi:hypothetical protein